MQIHWKDQYGNRSGDSNLADYVNDTLSRTHSEGSLEQALEQARNNSRAIGVLVDKLTDNGCLTDSDIEDICRSADKIKFLED